MHESVEVEIALLKQEVKAMLVQTNKNTAHIEQIYTVINKMRGSLMTVVFLSNVFTALTLHFIK